MHDENGKVDPAKSAEPTRPRGSASAKRPARVSNDFGTGANTKRPRVDNDFDSLIDPALTSTLLPQQSQPDLHEASKLMQSAADAIRLSSSEMDNAFGSAFVRPNPGVALPTTVNTYQSFERIPSPSELDVKAEHESPVLQHSSTQLSNGSLVSPPDSTSNGIDFAAAADNVAKDASSPERSAASPELGGNAITPASASRQSSRQPKNVDRFVPETFVAKSSGRRSSESHTQKQERRASSSAASALTTVSDTSRRLSSNTSGMVDAAPVAKSTVEVKSLGDRAGSTDSVAVIDDADERLARELHAQENGLRRRSTRA